MGSLLRRPATRVTALSGRDRPALLRLLADDPFGGAVLAARVHAVPGLDARRLGGAVLAVRGPDGELRGAAFDGGNLLPVGGGPDEWDAVGEALAGRPPRATSIVGRREAVAALWQVLEPAWGPARLVRGCQPLLALDTPARLPAGDPRVRAIRRDELDRYLPAAAAMFTEELAVSPYRGDAGRYRARVAGLLAARRAFGIVEDGAVVFKADLGAVSPHTCQVQGVWVRPDLRGRGIGTAALAGVLRHALTLAPTVSLYVNDFNTPARRMYARLGMREVGALSSVLLG